MAKFKKLTVLLSVVIVIIGAFMPAVIACDMDTKFIRNHQRCGVMIVTAIIWEKHQ